MSRISDHLCKLCGIKRARAISYHPSSNSTCEQMNRAIYKSLKVYCKDDNKNWATFLPTIPYSHRATTSVYSTQFSPHELFMGKPMVLPADSLIHIKTEGTGSVHEYMRSLEERLKLLHQIANENILASQEIYKKQYDKKAKPCEYAV